MGKKKIQSKATGAREKCLLVINTFIAEGTQISWPREMKMAKKLWERYPDEKFWVSIKGYRTVPTLSWMLTAPELFELGKKFEQFKKDSLELIAPTPYNLETEKIGEDRKNLPASRKTLLQFLRK